MTKKKRKVELKPWCWYCDREFADEKVLIDHQRAKHFKCHICNKKLSTASGMHVHISQVHKETITKVPNAIGGRETLEIEIFGMEGVPEADLQAHIAEVESKLNPNSKRLKLDSTSSSLTLAEQLAAWKNQQAGAAVTPIVGVSVPTIPGAAPVVYQPAGAPFGAPYPPFAPGPAGALPPFPPYGFPPRGPPMPPMYPGAPYGVPPPFMNGAPPVGWPPGQGFPPPGFPGAPPGIPPYPGQPGMFPVAGDGGAGAASEAETAKYDAPPDLYASGVQSEQQGPYERERGNDGTGVQDPSMAGTTAPAKREKADTLFIVYNEQNISMEEKRAQLPMYRFVPDT
ncbi:hypothetical protein BJ742DRAFT_844379 [Cladochytrium replicatum]|nr:hypothetical protein BJ742DRAFT_844379 [Cladochytrium replicatum]